MLNSYWEYAGTRYRNKFQAIDASNGKVRDISYHIFPDSSFDTFDFSVEPKESFSQLIKDRALQLRDTYPYLKLWFSGGADSTTMLNTFLTNNIFINEICVYRFSPNNCFNDNEGDYEILNYAIPFLKKIQNEIPNTKIKIIDYGKDYYDQILTDSWFYKKNSLSLRHFAIPKINGKNFCNIFGCLDPLVISDNNNNFYHEIWDTSNTSELANARNIELFFTSPNMLKLHSKQCHLMKQYLIDNPTIERNNWNEQKKIIRNNLRDVAIAPEPSWFSKAMYPKDNMFFNTKDRVQYKQYSKTQKDKIKYLYSKATVNNYLLPNLITSHKARTLYLGKG
jgi:hypothetical protein